MKRTLLASALAVACTTAHADPGAAFHAPTFLELAGIILRHRARKGETKAELSGHYHPRFQVRVRDRAIRRPCAVIGAGENGAARMILPAYGALTGGMNAADPAILAALQPSRAIDAVVPAGGKLATFPLWRKAA